MDHNTFKELCTFKKTVEKYNKESFFHFLTVFTCVCCHEILYLSNVAP